MLVNMVKDISRVLCQGVMQRNAATDTSRVCPEGWRLELGDVLYSIDFFLWWGTVSLLTIHPGYTVIVENADVNILRYRY